jgi:hypothetical protein
MSGQGPSQAEHLSEADLLTLIYPYCRVLMASANFWQPSQKVGCHFIELFELPNVIKLSDFKLKKIATRSR